MVNRILGDLHRCLAGEKPRNLDLVLSTIEFSYKNSINHSISHSPFEVVHDLKHHQPH